MVWGPLFYYGHSSVANDFEFPIQFVKFLTVFMPFMIFSSIINHFSRALIESNKIGAKFKFFIFHKKIQFACSKSRKPRVHFSISCPLRAHFQPTHSRYSCPLVFLQRTNECPIFVISGQFLFVKLFTPCLEFPLSVNVCSLFPRAQFL